MKKKFLIGAFALGLGIFSFTTEVNATMALPDADKGDLYSNEAGNRYCCGGSHASNCAAAACK